MDIQTRQHLHFVPPQIVPRRNSMNSLNQGSSALAYILQKGSLGGPVLGKRTRDSMDQMNSVSRFPSFVGGGEIFRQVEQYQFDIDSILSQHTKKIKLELEESQKNHARMVVGAIREGVMKKLNEKDEQIQRIDKLNSLLQQRLKSLFIENQLYRNMALTNEAMANSLRTNLEQLLVANVNNKHHSAGTGRRSVAEDAESCCGQQR
ncbi:putative BOI-related E3 ubiquitin-protein ligase 3 [Abeliophyllum distichum]|uniref:BOI-related E3 ubiquitin-protein ligase 3 n=1 Tax=Abeliophyllum distichum TaxID=126358 RepID=A0ABD1PU36_9LAMI